MSRGRHPNAHPQVIHLRNLPYDVLDDEIRDLCAPWGQVVAVKSKVGCCRAGCAAVAALPVLVG